MRVSRVVNKPAMSNGDVGGSLRMEVGWSTQYVAICDGSFSKLFQAQ